MFHKVASWRCRALVSRNVTEDDEVNFNDLDAIINSWGPCPPQLPPCPGYVVPMSGAGVVDYERSCNCVCSICSMERPCDYYAWIAQLPSRMVDAVFFNQPPATSMVILDHWGTVSAAGPASRVPLDIVLDGREWP
jgi:NAD-dependent dihydropyrimidine dehydrogenase PreA subunit